MVHLDVGASDARLSTKDAPGPSDVSSGLYDFLSICKTHDLTPSFE